VSDAAQKVIVGRGVLLDWAGWMDQKNETVDTFSVSLGYIPHALSPLIVDRTARSLSTSLTNAWSGKA